ncbi:MAG: transposase [Akkermansia sp.]
MSELTDSEDFNALSHQKEEIELLREHRMLLEQNAELTKQYNFYRKMFFDSQSKKCTPQSALIQGVFDYMIDIPLKEDTPNVNFAQPSKKLKKGKYSDNGITSNQVSRHSLLSSDEYKKNAIFCAPVPKTIISDSIVSASFLAYLVQSQYDLDLSRECQLEELDRMGVSNITQECLYQWLEEGSQNLVPLYNIVHASLLKEDVLCIDETPVLSRQQEKSLDSILLMRGCQSKQIYYHWATSCSNHVFDYLLRQNNVSTSLPYQGVVITEHYDKYDSWVHRITMVAQRPIQASCWTQARGQLVEIKDKCSDSKFCGEIIEAMTPFYSLERDIRENKNISLDEICQRRQNNLPAILNLFKKLNVYYSLHSPSGILKKVIKETMQLEDKLHGYLSHPQAYKDNNAFEGKVCKVKTDRDKWIISGYPDAGRTASIYYTMIADCKRVGADPLEWLTFVFEEISQLKGGTSPYLALMPAEYVKTSKHKNA